MLHNSRERSQCLIHGLRIREDFSYIWIQHHHISALGKTRRVLPANPAAEVIFFQHLWILLVISLLTHISSFHWTKPGAR